MKKNISKLVIGWREWCALPDLELPGVLAKIDTGAKTSALHAFKIKKFSRAGKPWVRFAVHPIQRHRHPEIYCESPILDIRDVTSSNGARESRIVINTTMAFGPHTFLTELTLTNRDEMGYRMLIGRQSLTKRFLVDPGLSLTLGDRDEENLYPELKHSGEMP